MASATLYRMVLPEHTCPYGVAAKRMLESAGYEVDDRILKSREEVERFKSENRVLTTPLIIIDGEPVGGMTELDNHLRAAEHASPS